MPTLVDLLAGWMPRQRWFAAKGADLSGGVHLVGRIDLPATEPGVRVGVYLARWAGSLYQVPLTHRPEPVEALAGALIGVCDGAWVYDGPHDGAFVHALVALVREQRSAGPAEGRPACALRGVRPSGGHPIPRGGTFAVLRGEQSNTSVVLDAAGSEPVILKLFRVVHPGENPDVVVQAALAAAGCTRVPQPAGWVEGTWPTDEPTDRPDEPGDRPTGEPGDRPEISRQHGHLAFVCEFLAGSRDGWSLATEAVAAGRDFSEPARALGRVSAEVHAAMAAALPSRPASAESLARLAADLRHRLDWALAQVPELARTPGLAAAAHRVLELLDRPGSGGPGSGGPGSVGAAVGALPAGARLQQIHGDYHLGQVLHTPDRGWVVLDFEGEPLRPMAERTVPDLALRDVAGMVRSFDYAAGHAELTARPGEPDAAPDHLTPTEWARRARAAYLAGYADGGGADPVASSALLGALELDKALYEVVYETRNRPSWAPIPLRAVRRITSHGPND
ncbi:MAG: phosphotransferase [Kineosporiaceae bacterium]|nr:phosphotransferase [Kineosporiaceae bacterium]